MRKLMLATLLAMLSQPALASVKLPLYAATFDDEYGFSGSFAGRDLNGDETLTKDELTRFDASYTPFTSHPFDSIYRGGYANLFTLEAFQVTLLVETVFDEQIVFPVLLDPCLGVYDDECDFDADGGEEVVNFGGNTAPLIWTVTPAAVPLPASGFLMGLAVLCLAAWRRRQA